MQIRKRAKGAVEIGGRKCTTKIGYKKMYVEANCKKSEYKWNESIGNFELVREEECNGQTKGQSRSKTTKE